MLHPGQVIDRYTVVSVLGEGGMGVVYRVRHNALDSDHALKVLTIQGHGLASRMMAEGRAQAGLKHPNVISVTDVVEVDGLPGLVMEMVDGGSLDEWIHAQKPGRAQRLELFRQVCEGVAVAHSRGWVHRDLKPGNVLIDTSSSSPIAKVADFGLVKAILGDDIRTGPKTRGGVPMGTPGFMAPEQIENAAGVDARADVFSLGCLLVWLLTGRGPFEAETVLDTFAKVAKGDATTLPGGDPLRSVVQRALATHPDERYPDAGALLAAMSGRPTPRARRAGRSAWVLSGGLAFMGVVALGVGVLVCTGVGMVASRSGPTRAQETAPVPDPIAGCPPEGRLGVVFFPDDVKIRKGKSRTVRVDTPVYAGPKNPKVICTLPSGTRIRAANSTKLNLKGTWLDVYGQNLAYPSSVGDP